MNERVTKFLLINRNITEIFYVNLSLHETYFFVSHLSAINLASKQPVLQYLAFTKPPYRTLGYHTIQCREVLCHAKNSECYAFSLEAKGSKEALARLPN